MTPELFAALAAAQGELENASKNAANPHFRSRYADLAEVLNTVRPVLSKHGLCVIQSPSFDGQLVSVATMLGHASGGHVSSTVSCVPAKTDAQGVGAATTYLRRYGLAALVGVSQEDDDGQSAAHGGRAAVTPYTPRELVQHDPGVASALADRWARLEDVATQLRKQKADPPADWHDRLAKVEAALEPTSQLVRDTSAAVTGATIDEQTARSLNAARKRVEKLVKEMTTV